MVFMSPKQEQALAQFLQHIADLPTRMQTWVGLPANRGSKLGQFVDDVDKAIEDQIVDYLRAKFAGDSIAVRGKTVHSKSTSGAHWIVIPLDGHDNFARGAMQWSTAICRYETDTPTNFFVAISLPAPKLLFSASTNSRLHVVGQPVTKIRSPGLLHPVVALGTKAGHATAAFPPLPGEENWLTRDFGCITASIIEMAHGRLDGYHSSHESPWMITLVTQLVLAMGGSTLTIDPSKKWEGPRPFTCGNDEFIKEIQRGLKSSEEGSEESAEKAVEEGCEEGSEESAGKAVEESSEESSEAGSEEGSEESADEAAEESAVAEDE